MQPEETIPVSDLARQTRAVVERLVADPAARFIVMRNNRPVAVIAGVGSQSAPPGGARTEVLRKRDLIRTLAAAHGARSVLLFGSAARGEERPDSDLDFLIELGPGRSLVDVIALEQDLADALGRKVDVVTARSVKRRVLKEALRDAVRIV